MRNEKNKRIWEVFAEEINGIYIPEEREHSDRTLIAYKGFDIFFDYYRFYASGKTTMSKVFTRVLIPYKSLDQFHFHIFEDELMFKVAKFFGFQDIKINKTTFDKRFIIKSNHEVKLKTLLMDDKIVHAIEGFQKISILTSGKMEIWNQELPEHEYVLGILIDDHVKDLETLHRLKKEIVIPFFERFKDLISIEPSQLKKVNNN